MLIDFSTKIKKPSKTIKNLQSNYYSKELSKIKTNIVFLQLFFILQMMQILQRIILKLSSIFKNIIQAAYKEIIFQMIGKIILAIVILLITDLKLHPSTKCHMEAIYVPEFELPEILESQKIRMKAEKYLPPRTIGKQQAIPYYIYQTNQFDQVPKNMKIMMNAVIEKNPQFAYRYFNASERRDFIQKHMGKTMLECFDKIIPPTYKGNVFRFSLLYTYGGCYMDSGFMTGDSLSKIIQPNMTYVGWRDGLNNSDNSSRVNSGCFCVSPRHKILQQTLNSVVKSVSQENYGIDGLDISGTRKLTRAFINQVPECLLSTGVGSGYFANRTIAIYDYEYPDNNCLCGDYFNPDGSQLFSCKYPNYNGDMFWYTGKRPYYTFYSDRNVYNSSIILKVPKDYNVAGQLQNTHIDFRLPQSEAIYLQNKHAVRENK